jgi:outer membrane receptor protein involved in Fe transport
VNPLAMIRRSAALRALCVAAVFCFLACSLVFGQITNSAISGTVTDASGAVVAGASIQVKNVATGVTRTIISDAQGRYNALDLLVGDYEVQASIQGFQTVVRKGITLTVGSRSVIDFSLTPGQQQQTITVEAQVSQVETTSSAMSMLVEPKQVENLPLNGRNYTQLLMLAPGVQQTASTFPSGFYGRGADYSFSGARPEGQAFLMDGTNVQNFWNHGPGSAVLGTTLGVEAIAEFSAQTNTYSAQFGGAGGSINAVTKSGTNGFHGSVFEFLRNSALDSRSFTDGAKKPPFKRNQFGGAIGGPIKKDKAFFFFNYEGLRNRQGLTNIAFVPDENARLGILPGSNTPLPLTPQIKTLLGYYPHMTSQTAAQAAGGIGQVGVVDTQVGDENYYVARVDYNISDKDSFFARYVYDTAKYHDPFSGSAVNLWPETHNTGNHYATIEEKHLFSPTIVNLLRGGFVRTREGSDLDNNLPGLYFYTDGRKNGTIGVTGLSPLGSSIFLPFWFVQNKYSFADEVIWTKGSHSIRFGGTFERVQSNVNAPGWLGGQYVFNSLSDFLHSSPFLFFGPLQSQSDGYRDFREINFTPYIQDDWKVSKRLTLNLGVRYDWVSNPVTHKHPLSTILDYKTSTGFTVVPNVFKNNPSTRNFDPRFGFAWDPFDDHKTSIRGGFGMFHNPVVPRTYASGYYFNPPYSFVVQVFPQFPVANITSPLPSQSNAVNYDTPSTPYMTQWNLNIQRELPGSTILTIGYVGSRGTHLFYQRDQNPPIPTIGANGQRVFSTPGPFGPVTNPRVNPALGPYNGAEPQANSSYQSLQVNANRRFRNNLQAQLGYTYSHCIDTSSNTYGLEGGFPAMDPYDARRDRGSCLFDRRHTLVASALWAIPFKGKFTGHQVFEGWQIGGILTVRSGGPYTITDGFDYPGMGAAFVAPRPNLNAGRTADNITLGSPDKWFDPTAFSLPPAGQLGNLGRDNFIGPHTRNFDFSVMKDTAIPSVSEQFRIQFRAEFFNITNHPNYGQPVGGVFVNGGAPNPTVAQITTLRVPMRQIQFGLKIAF